jgi:hypothetical protein
VASREDHSARIEGPHELRVDVVRVQLAVDTGLANAPRDELRDLGAEIQDEDPVEPGLRKTERRRSAALAGARLGRISRCGNWGPPS